MASMTDTEIMTTTASVVDAVVDQYLELFTEEDDDVRAEQAHAICVDDVRVVDPLFEAVGPDRLAAAIGALQEQMPGHSLARTTAVDAHHDQARFGWTVTGPDGAIAITGIDVLSFAPDGRIQLAVGFLGELTPVS
jgi:hypothetical protein